MSLDVDLVGPGADDRLRQTIEFVRPRFVAQEAVERIFALARQRGLDVVVDGRPCDADGLLDAWAEGNAAAVRALAAAGQAPPFMPADAGQAWWEYTRARDSLGAVLGEDVFVPKLVPVLGDDGTQVERLMSWPDAVSCVLPACEHVVVLRSTPGQAEPYDVRLARGPDVAAALDDLLVPAPVAVRGLRWLRGADQAEAARRLEQVPTRPMHSFSEVPPGGWTDVR